MKRVLQIAFAIVGLAGICMAFQCGSDPHEELPSASIVGTWEYQSGQEVHTISPSHDTTIIPTYPLVRNLLLEAGGIAKVELQTYATVYPPEYKEVSFGWHMIPTSDTLWMHHSNFGNIPWEILELTDTKLTIKVPIPTTDSDTERPITCTNNYRRR